MPWPAEREAALARLWADEALSAGAIGKLLKVSKNAVVAKARRMDLPGRASLIKPPAPGAVVLSAWERARKDAGEAPLPAGHPIALAVLDGGAALVRGWGWG